MGQKNIFNKHIFFFIRSGHVAISKTSSFAFCLLSSILILNTILIILVTEQNNRSMIKSWFIFVLFFNCVNSREYFSCLICKLYTFQCPCRLTIHFLFPAFAAWNFHPFFDVIYSKQYMFQHDVTYIQRKNVKPTM